MVKRCELLKCVLINTDFCESCTSKIPKMKTYANWNSNLDEYLKIGDVVDEEMKMYFLNVLPPLTWTNEIIQISEPYSSVEGRNTYSTLVNTEHGWTYAGNCHKGKYEHKISEYERMKQEVK